MFLVSCIFFKRLQNISIFPITWLDTSWTDLVRLFDLAFRVSSDKYTEVELVGPSLSLVIFFGLKSILSGVSIATSAFFFFLT